MVASWPKRLKQFSIAVDVVDDETFRSVENHVEEYFRTILKCHYFCVLIDGSRERLEGGELAPVLKTIWSSNPAEVDSCIRIRRPDKTQHQPVWSYVTRKPLWVVTNDDSTLADAAKEIGGTTDEWSNAQQLPRYRSTDGNTSKTSIIVPLECGDRTLGVINFKFEKHIPCSKAGKDHIRMIADALGRIILMWKTTVTQLDGTRDYMQELEPSPRPVSPLEKQKVFVSSSDRADEEVIDVILEVLGEFHEDFETSYWKEVPNPGNIMNQVRARISDCAFGVCYFSEPDNPDAGGKRTGYRDNPNVLFEAGMMEMLLELHDHSDGLISRWIPVREKQEGNIPFNFAHNLILMVPRKNGSNELEKEVFTSDFKRAVENLLSQLQL